jgi:hypothetical protein
MKKIEDFPFFGISVLERNELLRVYIEIGS